MTTVSDTPALWRHPALVIPAFLIAVNLICGLVAVEFRYPSLWGNINVFEEYAYPMPLSWAMAHWPSMLLMSVLLFRLSSFSEAQVTKTQIGLIAGIGLCIAIEFVFGGGKFHRIPFILFVLVDLSLVFVLALLLYQPRRPILACSFVFVVVLILASPTLRFEYEKYLYDQKTRAALEREAQRTREIEADNRSDK